MSPSRKVHHHAYRQRLEVLILSSLLRIGSSMRNDHGGGPNHHGNSRSFGTSTNPGSAGFDRLSNQRDNFVAASDHRKLDPDRSNASHLSDPSDVIVPIPDWSTALREWGVCWQMHVYGSAAMFLLLTLLSVAIFFRFRARVRRFQIVLNILMLLATSGLFRGVFMLVDPYGYQERMAGLMVGVMTQAVYPLLCACYGLTQSLLIRVTNVDVGPSKLRSLSALLGCTLAYLFLVVVVETVVYYERHLKLLLLLDSGCFIAWALYLGITFICSGFRLTQYTSETKKARKELNAFGYQRRSASNNTALSAISGTSGDTRVSTIKADVTSLSPSSTRLETSLGHAAGDATTTAPSSNLSQAYDAALYDHGYNNNYYSSSLAHHPTTHQPNRTSGGFRLSRPRMKISNRNHMTITIVTDDDDQSTSSTDVERSASMELTQSRSLRKVYKHKHKKQRKTSKTRKAAQESPLKKNVDNGIDSLSEDQMRCNSDTNDDDYYYEIEENKDSKYSQIPTDEIAGVGGENHKVQKENNFRLRKKITRGPKNSPRTAKNVSELPLLESCRIAAPAQNRQGTIIKESSLTNLITSVDNRSLQADVSCTSGSTNIQKSDERVNDPSSYMQRKTLPEEINAGDSKTARCKGKTAGSRSQYAGSNQNPTSGPFFSNNTDNEFLSQSVRENGYLADTENVHSGNLASRLACDQYGSGGSDVLHRLNDPDSSDQSDVSSCVDDSDGDNFQSPPPAALCDRLQCNFPASVGLFRIRQSKMVHRAVHLTYFVTFLFMFACLMQLYTVFGVYGVLGTIQRPDPWPWLVFHTIYRLLECAIGFTVAAVAFIALNHRHQRAKRRLQQQQQQNQQHQHQQQRQPQSHQLVHRDDQASTISMTGDCVV